jgi:hypothetical protein
MNKPGAKGLTVFGLIIAVFASAAAYAVDGVILIDQNKAIAGSVTPGDAPGFPVTISQPGSYRLSSNLTVTNQATRAIQINANNVSLDLNGFSIIGPGIFPTEMAINGDGRKGVRIFNGVISGFTQGIGFVGAAELVTLERLTINTITIDPQFKITVLGLSIRVAGDIAARSIIRDVAAKGQIQINCPSLVMDTVTDGNVVELNIPDNGNANFFPTNCKGQNVF